MKVTPPSKIPHLNLPRRRILPMPSKLDIAAFYERKAQILFDALTPFVDSYENGYMETQKHLPDSTQVALSVTLGEIRAAQEAVLPTVDIFV